MSFLGGPSREEKSYKCLISGEMTISKFKEGREAANLVHVLLAVIRLPSVETDITLTLYTPIKVSERSSSKVDRTISKEESVAIFKQVLSSFEIRDYSLFG